MVAPAFAAHAAIGVECYCVLVRAIEESPHLPSAEEAFLRSPACPSSSSRTQVLQSNLRRLRRGALGTSRWGIVKAASAFAGRRPTGCCSMATIYPAIIRQRV